MSASPKMEERKVRLRKLLNYRNHYSMKAVAKSFHNVKDWSAHRDWILDGETWVAADIVDDRERPSFYAGLVVQND